MDYTKLKEFNNLTKIMANIVGSFILQNPVLAISFIIIMVIIIILFLVFLVQRIEIKTKLFNTLPRNAKKEHSSEEIGFLENSISNDDKIILLIDTLYENIIKKHNELAAKKKEKLSLQIKNLNNNLRSFYDEFKDKVFSDTNHDNSYQILFIYWIDKSTYHKVFDLVVEYIERNNFTSMSADDIETIINNLLVALKSEFNESFSNAPSYITNISDVKKTFSTKMSQRLRDILSDVFSFAKSTAESYQDVLDKIEKSYDTERYDRIHKIFPHIKLEK